MRRAFPLLLLLLIACGPFFYQAPPSIGNYPERIAAKRWQALAREAELAEPALPEAPQRVSPSTPAQRIAEIDHELAANRRGPYSARRANFLHEQRELAANDAPPLRLAIWMRCRGFCWTVGPCRCDTPPSVEGKEPAERPGFRIAWRPFLSAF